MAAALRAARGGTRPSSQTPRQLFESGDGRNVRADQLRLLLIDGSLPPITVSVLKMGEGGARSDRIHFVVTVVVKRQMDERVIAEAQHDVTHGVRLGLGKLRKDP